MNGYIITDYQGNETFIRDTLAEHKDVSQKLENLGFKVIQFDDKVSKVSYMERREILRAFVAAGY